MLTLMKKIKKKLWPHQVSWINIKEQEKLQIVNLLILVVLERVIEKCLPEASFADICLFGD